MSSYHTPVLGAEVVNWLDPGPNKIFIDATAGGGGHTELLLNKGASVLAIDADRDAILELRRRFRGIDLTKLKVVRGNFRNLSDLCLKNGYGQVDGVIFDLGVSSYQIQSPKRGFSYLDENAQLDMRMDDRLEADAQTVLNTKTSEELYEIIAQYGEEKHARAIADLIHRTRKVKAVKSAGDLIGIVKRVTGKSDMAALSRVFQAIRIEVNDELLALKMGLGGAGDILKPGGRCAVLSYHSLEDRIVKLEFRKPCWRSLTGHPLKSGADEVESNKRARSAKLRVAEKNPG